MRWLAFVTACLVQGCANDARPGKANAPPASSGVADASVAPADAFVELSARAQREAPGLAELSRGELVGAKTLIFAPAEADGCLRIFADGKARLQDGPRILSDASPGAAAGCVRKGARVSVVCDADATVHYLVVGSTKPAR